MLERKYSLPFSVFAPFRYAELSKHSEGTLYVKKPDLSLATQYDFVVLNFSNYSRGETGSVKEFDELAEGGYWG
ncbi:hypothetical protein [Archaeoglobus sp.]